MKLSIDHHSTDEKGSITHPHTDMDALLEQARDIWEGQIVHHLEPSCSNPTRVLTISQDFKGQSLAEFLSTALLTLTGMLAFLAGFITQDIYKTLYLGLGGTAFTFIVVVPQWPFYNSKPEPWLPARVQRASSGQRQPVDLGGVQISVT